MLNQFSTKSSAYHITMHLLKLVGRKWKYGTSPVSFEVLKCLGESCNLLGLQMDLPGQSGLLLLATLPRRFENKKCFRLRFKAQQGSRIKAQPEPPGSAGGIISCGNVEGCQTIGRMGCALNHHMCTILYIWQSIWKKLEKASLHKKAAKVSFSLFKQVWPDWSQVAADSAHELVRSAVHLLKALQPDLNMSTSQQALYCTSTFSARCPLLLSKFCANGSGHACMAWCAESTGILPASGRRSASTIDIHNTSLALIWPSRFPLRKYASII